MCHLACGFYYFIRVLMTATMDSEDSPLAWLTCPKTGRILGWTVYTHERLHTGEAITEMAPSASRSRKCERLTGTHLHSVSPAARPSRMLILS